MNYYLTAASLKLASANTLTQKAYWALSKRRKRPRYVWPTQSEWILDRLPHESGCLLELGTGWIHAYSLYAILLRQDDVYCFDVIDRRNFNVFLTTIPVVRKQIEAMDLSKEVLERALERCNIMLRCRNFDEVYEKLGFHCQIDSSGMPQFANVSFDAIYSVDVLEHVEAALFEKAASVWFATLKDGGIFLAQVGLNDHHSVYDDNRQPKRYLRHSLRTWELLLGNTVQYCNRLTASAIISALESVGFVMECVDVELCDLNRA